MAFSGRLVFVAVAVLAAAVYWLNNAPLPDHYSDLKPAASKYARLRRITDRVGCALDVINVVSLATCLRTLVAYRTIGMDRSNTSEITTFDTKFDHVPVRIYLPTKRKQPSPGVVYYHGGGTVIGTLDLYDSLARKIAINMEAVVVSVDYRLTPEHRYTECLDDSEVATRYFAQHAAEWQVDPNKIVLSGDSAGGHLSVSISVRLRDKPSDNKFMPRALVIYYPFSQAANLSTESWITNQYDPFLSRELTLRYLLMPVLGMRYFDSRLREDALEYMRHNCFAAHPEFAARINRAFNQGQLFTDAAIGKLKLRAEDIPACPFTGARLHELSEVLREMMSDEFSIIFSDLSNLPTTYIATAQNDVLRDDAFILANRLRSLNVTVVHDNFPKLYHNYMTIEPEDTLQRAHAFLRDTVRIYAD